MGDVTDRTRVARVREAVRRLEAAKALLRRESRRENNPYTRLQWGQAEGLRLAIMEIERALSTDRESAIARQL
jgi:hypothetical protein